MKNSHGPRFPLALVTASLVGLTGTLAAVPAHASIGSSGHAEQADPSGPDIRLSRDPGSVVRAATVPALAGPQARTTQRGAQVGPRTSTSRFKMVAVTWKGSAPPEISVRTRSAGSWSGWRKLDHLHHGPNGEDPRATDLMWVGGSDGVQVRNTGGSTRGLELVLINPGRLASDTDVAPTRPPAARDERQAARFKRAPPPRLLGRPKWGADPDWRNGRPRYNRLMKQVHVHHTATGNRYSRADVPGILRGMYRYHTKNLGWFDIGYNFLVDRFGRNWVGRSGGPFRKVRGAHTLGFNQSSVGIAVIGNYEHKRPEPRLARGVIRIAAWKLDKYGKRARGTVVMRSQGSDRYRNGRWVRLPVIDGHRDTNYTACPGAKLYGKLPVIRRLAQRRMNWFD